VFPVVDALTGLPVVGMVGGGPLARMTHQAAIPLGQSLKVLASSHGDPAALVSPRVEIGAHTDLDALRSFAAGCEALTFDHEHVPNDLLRTLAAEGVTVRPGPDALLHAQDKLVMREKLATLGVPVPAFARVDSVQDALSFGEKHGWPFVLKAARGGYDGKGVWVLDGPEAAETTVAELLDAGMPLLAEEKVRMRRELAAVVARSPFGQGAAWPVVETVQSEGICVEVLAPAPDLRPEVEEQAADLALRVARALQVVGVLAVELFETGDGVLVNELAMRPHNSAHWTMDGSVTSQFEQHLRAVLDYPLGATATTAPATVMANVLGAVGTPEMGVDERMHHLFARFPEARVHWYGKSERPGRKVGHVNVCGADMATFRSSASLAADFLATGRWSDGHEVHR
jgi:5-(carboxyamino)imidazole ribonucleotide synthase